MTLSWLRLRRVIQIPDVLALIMIVSCWRLLSSDVNVMKPLSTFIRRWRLLVADDSYTVCPLLMSNVLDTNARIPKIPHQSCNGLLQCIMVCLELVFQQYSTTQVLQWSWVDFQSLWPRLYVWKLLTEPYRHFTLFIYWKILELYSQFIYPFR